MEEEHLRQDGGARADGIVYQYRIPMLEGRPGREHPIGSDDVLNLTIALNVADSLETFLELV